MATDFWASSHYKRWIVDRATLKQARADDLLYVTEPEYLDFLSIYFANAISTLGKKLQFRQRVIATAIVFFRRFYLKNSYCETDPFLVLSACCYVAAKAEESPVHIKNVVAESRALFSQEQYGVKTFPSDNTKLAEMEFYLVDDLECDLTVFHPYRTLLALCKKESGSHTPSEEAEAGELGAGIAADDGPRYWGTGEGRLELSEGALQTAWFIINDTYRSDLCLLYPPHLIAITAIYLTLVLHTPTQNSIAHLLPSSSSADVSTTPDDSTTINASSSSTSTPQQTRRSTRQSFETAKKSQNPIAFLADLNISLPLISTVAQQIISLYSLWDRYKEDATPDVSTSSGSGSNKQRYPSPYSVPVSPAKRPAGGGASRAGSHNTSHSASGTPDSRTGVDDLFGDGSSGSPSSQQGGQGGSNFSSASGSGAGSGSGWKFGEGNIVTPTFLSKMLLKMRESKLNDMSHPSTGRPVAVNKMLERTQAAG